MTAPIPVRVLRYRCPHCGRSASRPGRAREHMARCWQNPEARGCKTCKHFEAYGPEWGDSCGKDVDLTGRPACAKCGGLGYVFGEHEVCPDCAGDGAEIKPGPIVGCSEWEADPAVTARAGHQAPSDRRRNVTSADHPHTDPGDGRTECDVCGKWIYPVTHSCKGVPVTDAAWDRHRARTITNCPICHGSGDYFSEEAGGEGGAIVTCVTCRGSGRLATTRPQP